MLALKKYVLKFDKPRVLRIPNTKPGVSCVEVVIDNNHPVINAPSTQG